MPLTRCKGGVGDRTDSVNLLGPNIGDFRIAIRKIRAAVAAVAFLCVLSSGWLSAMLGIYIFVPKGFQ